MLDFAAEVMGVSGQSLTLKKKPEKDIQLLALKLAYIDSVAIASTENRYMVIWLGETSHGPESTEQLMCSISP